MAPKTAKGKKTVARRKGAKPEEPVKPVKSEANKKRVKKRNETFSIYIYKVLKQVHPKTGISSKAMSVLNSFVEDQFDMVVKEATEIAEHSKSKTLTARDLISTVRLVYPGELGRVSRLSTNLPT